MLYMTKDFTKIGLGSQGSTGETSGGAGDAMTRNQRIVLLAIKVAAGGFFLGGVWLLLGMPSPFASNVSFFIGIGCIISAAADLIAVKFIKRVWAKQQGH